jgi:transposase
MSKSRGRLRTMRREVESHRAAALRCPGCGKRNTIGVKHGRATCSSCGHFVPRDLYASGKSA